MQTLPSVMKSFSTVPEVHIGRSSFDRSHGYKTAFDTGYLVPIFFDEALPGDSFNLDMTVLARVSSTALTRPIMDNLFLETFFFFVPNRLIWSNFQKFMGEQANPGDSTSYLVPQIASPTTPGVVTGSLADYFGIPVGIATSFNFNALHFRAYNKCWNAFFRDENLQNSVPDNMGDGPDSYSDYTLLRRGKRHDYFTSCLPSPQKGTAVSLPLGTSATVKLDPSNTTAWQAVNSAAGHALITTAGTINTAVTGNIFANSGATPTIQLDPNASLYADLSTATAATINSLRQAIALQQMLEVDARGGTRYTEVIRAHFGVISPDARLQRPEYLGGGQTPININPVAGTNNVGSGTTAQGQLTAYGTAAGGGHGFTKSFVEHGVIIGLAAVRADLTYQQGLDRMFTRRTKYDYYWPSLATIGEQAVTNGEIYTQGNATDALVFGYQERFAEYRYKPSRITGVLRSNVSAGATSLQVWHLSQNFGSLPTLNSTFIQDTPPMTRSMAVTTEPQIIFDSYSRYHCARPMPMFGVPGLTRL